MNLGESDPGPFEANQNYEILKCNVIASRVVRGLKSGLSPLIQHSRIPKPPSVKMRNLSNSDIFQRGNNMLLRTTNAKKYTRLISSLACTASADGAGSLRKFVLIALVATAVTFTQIAVQAEDFGKPSRTDRQVSRLVSRLMQQDHLSTRPLNDEISSRAFDLYIKSLDPMKVYFTQSDITSFEVYRNQLDDQVQRGDYTAAFAIFKRFLERLDERVQLANELLDGEFDFERDEEMVTDRKLAKFPSSDAEARELWRKRIKYSLLVERFAAANEKKSSSDDASAKPKKDPVEKIRKRYNAYSKRMRQTDNEDVVEMFVTAVTASFDPHTSYMSKETFENFLIAMSLELEGIGATLQATDDGYTVIKRVVPGGAADKQGEIKVEDKIVSVTQGDGDETVDVTGMKLDDVVKLIRGKAGTTVRLGVMPENSNEIKTVSIVREKIKLEDSAARGKIFEEGEKADGSPYKIGVIDLPSFYADMSNRRSGEVRSTTRDVEKILKDFNAKGVDSVVLDLRRNGGGSLREAIDCTGLFIDYGPVVQVKDSYGQIQKHNDERFGMAWEKPLVVLTSKFSASASEILAGAVQDYGRGLVVGDSTTHGKGTVQNLVNLNQLLFRVENPPNMFGALKITMQQFYRPNGDSTQQRGVLADITLPSISDHMDVGESDLDYPVEFDRVPSARYSRLGLVSQDMLGILQKKSSNRIDQSNDFAKRIKNIEEYKKQKERKAVTLNEEKFLARRKELDAEKEEEKNFEDQVNHSSDDIKRTYYLEEVLRITTDYLKLLKDNKVASK